MTIEKRIKLYLVEEGIKQKDLAERADLCPKKLNASLNGKRKLNVDEFARLVNSLEISADLFIYPDTKNRPLEGGRKEGE